MKDKTLVKLSSTDAKRFLIELANLNDKAAERFEKNFGKLLPGNVYSTGFILSQGSMRPYTQEEHKERVQIRILGLRDLVRKVWIEPDLRTKRYGVFLLWKYGMFSEGWHDEGIPSGLPSPSLFEQAIQLLIEAADLVRYCRNPECYTPYFFASRRNQKYCSDACALPAQREFKRQWWAEHGEKWRASRSIKNPPKKKSSKKERK